MGPASRPHSVCSNFTTESGSARCRALTAPAFKDIHGASSSAAGKRGPGEAEAAGAQLSKKARKAEGKAKRKANGKDCL